MKNFAEPLLGQRANPKPLLFRGARLVDPSAGTETPGDLLVSGGKIAASGSSRDSRSARIFSLS